jgi:hypothetical protein
MNDFEAGCIEHCAFKSGVLISADDEHVESSGLHARTDVLVATIDLFLTWQSDLGGWSRLFHLSAPKGAAMVTAFGTAKAGALIRNMQKVAKCQVAPTAAFGGFWAGGTPALRLYAA